MTANEILNAHGLLIGSATRADVLAIHRAADDEGTIQAERMLRLTSDPRMHTTTSERQALLHAGCHEPRDWRGTILGHEIDIDTVGVVREYDEIAGHYTVCHSLPPRVIARARRAAGWDR